MDRVFRSGVAARRDPWIRQTRSHCPAGPPASPAACRRLGSGSCSTAVCRGAVGATGAGDYCARGGRDRGGDPGAWATHSRTSLSSRFFRSGLCSIQSGTAACSSTAASCGCPSAPANACASTVPSGAAPDYSAAYASTSNDHADTDSIATDAGSRARLAPATGSASCHSVPAETDRAPVGDGGTTSSRTGRAHPNVQWVRWTGGPGADCSVNRLASCSAAPGRRDGVRSPARLPGPGAPAR